jgi:hypothetical protein
MNKLWFHLGVISSLAILSTSCGGDGDKQAKTPAPSPSIASSPKAAAPAAATPTPAASPMVAATTPATSATAAAKPAGDQPAPGKSVTPDLAAGLIPPTDGENWARTVPKGRPDPFGVLNLQPIEAAPIDAPGQAASQPQPPSSAKAKSASAAKVAPASTAKTASATTVKGSIVSAAKATTPSRTAKVATAPAVEPKVKKAIATKIAPIVASKLPTVASKSSGVNIPSPTGEVALDTNNPSKAKKNGLPTTVATKPIIKPIKSVAIPAKKNSPQSTIALKPIPQPLKEVATPGQVAPTAVQPTLARTVGISGVIQSGGITQVIVKLPTESFSRYLEVGARLFDGKVKVKRVEGEQTLSPIVILEEAGIEVNRRVGDAPDGGASKEAQPK